jgi:hypothetical protein
VEDFLSVDFVTITCRAAVDRSVDETWRRIGRFFDLGLFLDVECKRVKGTGDIGSLRLINGVILEPLVGKGRHSYTYAQIIGPMSACAYHGCVACDAAGEGAEIVYTLTYDQSKLDPDRRRPEYERLTGRFSAAVAAMRKHAEAPEPLG